MTDQPANPTTYQDSPQSPPEACHEVFNHQSDHFTSSVIEVEPENRRLSTTRPRRMPFVRLPPGQIPNSQSKRATNLTQLLDTQQTIYQTLMEQKLTAAERAALARALCEVDKRIRVWRGLPDPGVFRPDLDPVKNAKMLRGKRGKGSPVLDLPAAQAFSEAVEKVKAEASAAGANLDDEPETTIPTKHTQNASSGLTNDPKTLPNTLRSQVSESVKPEGNPPESKAPKTPAPKPPTKPAGKPKE